MTNHAPWFDVATALEAKGIVEIPGVRDNADIMYMAKALRVWYPHDEIAWCGLFVAYCLFKAGIKDKMPSNILGAKSWRNYASSVAPGKLAQGDILVFWRGTPKGPNGHVGFYVSETDTAYKVRGGNQGNSVADAWVAKARLISARRPVGYTGGSSVKENTPVNTTLSTDER